MHQQMANLENQLVQQQQQLTNALSLLEVIASSSITPQNPPVYPDPAFRQVVPGSGVVNYQSPAYAHPAPVRGQTTRVFTMQAPTELGGPVAPSRVYSMPYPNIEIDDLSDDPTRGSQA